MNYTQVERNLTSVPTHRRALKAWERFIEDFVSGSCLDDVRVQGGDSIPVQERILQEKERNSEYQRHLRNIQIVEAAMETLNQQEKDFVELLFWKDLSTDAHSHEMGVALRMGFSERTVWRWKDRLLRKLEPEMRCFDPTLFFG